MLDNLLVKFCRGAEGQAYAWPSFYAFGGMMQLDNFGPTNAMRRTLELQQRTMKPKTAPTPAEIVNLPQSKLKCGDYIEATWDNFLRNEFFFPGRILKIQRILDNGDAHFLLVPGITCRWSPESLQACKPPPWGGQVKWGILVKPANALCLGKIYKIMDGRFLSNDVNLFNLPPEEVNKHTGFVVDGATGILGGDSIEPCHGLHIDNCNFVRCIDEADIPHAIKKGKIYKVNHKPDANFIGIDREDGAKSGINKCLFEPVYTEQG